MSGRTKICVLGSGAWGTALACVAARAGHDAWIWGRNDKTVDAINKTGTNPQYLAGLKLAEGISATSDLETAVRSSELVLFSVPAQSLSSLLPEVKKFVGKAALVACCKGIDRKSGKLPSQLVEAIFPDSRIGALSGPSFAIDVVRNLPTAVTVAGKTDDLSIWLAETLSAGNFRCYAGNDLRGVEIGGALKNVLALAVGAARGMELGASAEAALIARGFAEICRIALKLGAERETLSGLSGLGDLVLTCSSNQSRNFTCGVAMGKGKPLDGLPLAEGAHTAGVALEIAKREAVDVPIIEAVVSVLEKRVSAQQAVGKLLTRPLKRETI